MTEPIPYGRQSVDESDVEAVAAVLRGEWLTTGPTVRAFEAALSARMDGTPVAVVSSGTAALHCAYAAAGVGPGTEVVTSPLTFASTAATALHLGATVRFADVDDDTLTLSPDAVAAAMSARTRVVAPVDYAGQPADVPGIQRIAHAAGAIVVEDAAHAIGARIGDRPVGAVADLTIFSFHPVKTMTTGEGGAVAAARADLMPGVRRFRNQGLVRQPELLRNPDEGGWHQEVQSLGLNYRLPDILAALGLSQLRRLEGFIAERQRLVTRYRRMLGDVDGLRLLGRVVWGSPAWHLFPVRILHGRRRAVFEGLRAVNIGVQVHYLPVHRHPLFEDLGYAPRDFPVADRAYAELLSLPLFVGLTDAQQDRVVAELLRLLQA